MLQILVNIRYISDFAAFKKRFKLLNQRQPQLLKINITRWLLPGFRKQLHPFCTSRNSLKGYIFANSSIIRLPQT